MGDDRLTPELVVRAYCCGAFPMADDRTGAGGVHWYSPDPRAVLPLDERFRVRRSLAKRVRHGPFTVTRDRAFDEVIRRCAEPRPYAEDTWISGEILDVFCELHRLGVAHSVEAWVGKTGGGELAGGLYGVALGGAFFGESMFSRETDASQVCLVRLVEHLRTRGYTLLDVQFSNPHLEQFGLIEIARAEYLARLDRALALDVSWEPTG